MFPVESLHLPVEDSSRDKIVHIPWRKGVFLEEVLVRSPDSMIRILGFELRGFLSSIEHLQPACNFHIINLLSLSFVLLFFSLFFFF